VKPCFIKETRSCTTTAPLGSILRVKAADNTKKIIFKQTTPKQQTIERLGGCRVNWMVVGTTRALGFQTCSRCQVAAETRA
jgi:hypothetical protein